MWVELRPLHKIRLSLIQAPVKTTRMGYALRVWELAKAVVEVSSQIRGVIIKLDHCFHLLRWKDQKLKRQL